jgi:hypothetical protein
MHQFICLFITLHMCCLCYFTCFYYKIVSVSLVNSLPLSLNMLCLLINFASANLPLNIDRLQCTLLTCEHLYFFPNTFTHVKYLHLSKKLGWHKWHDSMQQHNSIFSLTQLSTVSSGLTKLHLLHWWLC